MNRKTPFSLPPNLVDHHHLQPSSSTITTCHHPRRPSSHICHHPTQPFSTIPIGSIITTTSNSSAIITAAQLIKNKIMEESQASQQASPPKSAECRRYECKTNFCAIFVGGIDAFAKIAGAAKAAGGVKLGAAAVAVTAAAGATMSGPKQDPNQQAK